MERGEAERRPYPGKDSRPVLSIALGIALSLARRKIFVFDDDGALWMNDDRWQQSGCINRKISFTFVGKTSSTNPPAANPTVATADKIYFTGVARSPASSARVR
jgi:hypothetical protein